MDAVDRAGITAFRGILSNEPARQLILDGEFFRTFPGAMSMPWALTAQTPLLVFCFQKPLVAQPGRAKLCPRRNRMVALADAEAVAGRGENVQLGRDAGALQRQIHDHAVGDVAAADGVHIAMREKKGGVPTGMCRTEGDNSSLSLTRK